ncbi:MAG TPA: hypothetical protein VE080_01550 [Candidatus Aquicultoraceae bacterium]|nr:hypothetical protein [Candidatus Aquicultoraceae bacterium]
MVRTAGIVTADFLPDVRLDLPGKGRVDGAVRGAGRGFLAGAEIPLRILGEGMSGCSSKECGYVAIGILAVATATGTVGAVVGGVHGAIEAMPAREARRMEEATEELANLRIQEILGNRILEAGTRSVACRYVPIPYAAWSTPEEEGDYRFLTGEGFDSILEIGAVSVGFRGTKWGSDPPLSVFLTVRVRRYGGRDGKFLGEENLLYESGERKFAEWMADGAAPAEEQFERGYREIAGRVVAEIPCE